MGTYLSRLASANAGGIYLTRQQGKRVEEGEDLNQGKDSPIISQLSPKLKEFVRVKKIADQMIGTIHIDRS